MPKTLKQQIAEQRAAVRTPAPVEETPAPVAKAPAPVAKAPAPVAKAPAPVAKAPAPVSQGAGTRSQGAGTRSQGAGTRSQGAGPVAKAPDPAELSPEEQAAKRVPALLAARIFEKGVGTEGDWAARIFEKGVGTEGDGAARIFEKGVGTEGDGAARIFEKGVGTEGDWAGTGPSAFLDIAEIEELAKTLPKNTTTPPQLQAYYPPRPDPNTIGRYWNRKIVAPVTEAVREMLPMAGLVAGTAGVRVAEDLAQAGAYLTGQDEQAAGEVVNRALQPAINEAYEKGARDNAARVERIGPVKQAKIDRANSPEMSEARARADKIQGAGSYTRQAAVKKFLSEQGQANLNAAVLKRGGEEKITDAEYDSLESAANKQALADLLTLHQTGAWIPTIRPEDLDPPEGPDTRGYGTKLLDNLLPKSEVVDSDGTVARTENLPWWFVGTAMFSPIFATQAVFDKAAGEDFSDALLRNVDERRDPMTALIEVDDDLRADLASGDAKRVTGAVFTPSFFATALLLLVTPDVATVGVRVAKATQRTLAVANRADALAHLMKPVAKGGEGLSPAAAVQRVSKEIDTADQAAKALVTKQKLVKRIDKIEKAYKEKMDIEDAAVALESEAGRGAVFTAGAVAPEGYTLAKALRDAYLAKLMADDEIAAYLIHNKVSGVVPNRMKPVYETPEAYTAARTRQVEVVKNLKALEKQRADIVEGLNADRAARIAAGQTFTDLELAGTVRAATLEVRTQIAAALKEAETFALQEKALAGQEKFDAAFTQVGEDIVKEWGQIARGEETAAAAAAAAPPPVAPPPVSLTPMVDPTSLAAALGGTVSAQQAQRIAAAQTFEELFEALRGAPDVTKNAVARRMGAVDFAALQKTMKGTDAEVAAAGVSANARVAEARAAMRKAKDAYQAAIAAPGDYAGLAAARKANTAAERELAAAEKALASAAGVDLSAGAAKVTKAEGAAAKADEALAAARAEPTPSAPAGEALPPIRRVREAAEDLAEAETTLGEAKAALAAYSGTPKGLALVQKNVGIAEASVIAARAEYTKIVDWAKASVEAVSEEKLAVMVKEMSQPNLGGGISDAVQVTKNATTPAVKALLERRAAIVAEQVALNKKNMPAPRRAVQQAAIEARAADVEELIKTTTPAYATAVDKEWRVRNYNDLFQERLDRATALVRGQKTPSTGKAKATLEKAALAREGKIQKAQAAATNARIAADKARTAHQAATDAAATALDAAKARKAVADTGYAAASTAYGTAPKGAKAPPKGIAGQEKIDRALAAARDADKAWSEARDAAKAVDEVPQARETLRQALRDTRSEYETLAEALGSQAEAIAAAKKAANKPIPKGSDPALPFVENAESLQQRFDLAARDVRRLSRGRTLAIAKNIWTTITDTVKPHGEMLEQSFTPAMRQIGREMEGNFKEVGERLATALDSVTPPGGVGNRAALEGVIDYANDFKDGVSSGQMSGEYVALVATAYLQPPVIKTLSAAQRVEMVAVVRAWAADVEAGLETLRDQILAVSQRVGGKTGVRATQEGDLYLAQGVGYGGAERRAIVDMRAQNLAYGEADALAINSTLLGTFDRATATGGHPLAARGRRLAARVLQDPAEYRPKGVGGVFTKGTAVRPEVVKPLVRAVNPVRGSVEAERVYSTAVEALDDLEMLLLEIEKTMKGDIYVPRAMRDMMLRQVDAAVATTNLSGVMADLGSYRNFWKQVAVLGSGTSRPKQFFLDSASDYMRTAVNAGFGQAVKAAARSLPSQALGAPFMAQIAMVTDAATMALRVPGARTGRSARLFDKWVSNFIFTSPVDGILARSEKVVAGQYTGKELEKAFRNAGVFENFASGQFTRSVAAGVDVLPVGVSAARGALSGLTAGLVVGGPGGAVVGSALGATLFGGTSWGRNLMAKNWRSLQELQNIAATRRRVAIAVGLVESGMPLEEAARKAVQIVGDFSRELGPAERGWLTVLFPFWSYGKFAARSAAVSLVTNPYRSSVLTKLGQGTAAALSTAFDATPFGDDEYGYHPAAMEIEGDPAAVLEIKAYIAEKMGKDWIRDNPDKWERLAQQNADMGWTDAEGVQHPPAPRASERYARMVRELRKIPYDEVFQFMQGVEAPEAKLVEIRMDVAREGGRTAEEREEEARKRGRAFYAPLREDMQLLAVYWAPSVTRHMLPAYAQARPTVLLPKKRSQADEGYFHAGTGRYERPGDETRFYQLPQDPLTEGITVPILTIAAGLNLMQGKGDATALRDLISGMFQDPYVAQVISELDLTGVSGQQTKIAIPTRVGENLLPFMQSIGMTAEQKLYRGQDPLASGEDKYKTAYFLPATTMLALYLFKPIVGEMSAALDFEAAAEALGGEAPFIRGEPDIVDYASIYGNFLIGQRAQSASPSQTQARFEREAETRVERANIARGKVPILYRSESTMRLRDMSREEARPDFEQASADLVRRLQAGELSRGGDIPLARAWLVSSGTPREEVASLEESDVLARVRATK